MAKNLMIQGTMSNAGKSVVTAGILRVLKQDGYRVAPFKSQNMALNSYITEDGLEMGRAQVMQAEAAGIAPQVCMNPILLKPTSDVGSQVIVNGAVRGNMTAADYFRYKKELVPDILRAYKKLDDEYDIVVIEGAGSPAEINLKNNDIVNMGLARLVDAPVLLVGDIDRGGVFAQLAGTIMLLEEEERARVRGLIINKFRGDVKILEPGLKQLYDICKIPVTGVIPYMHLDLDDEDSLSERLSDKEIASRDVFGADNTGGAHVLDIAVIKLPHISNFTDFNALEAAGGVRLRYVSNVNHFGVPDMVIIPGTKNTIGDLKWLRQNGLETMILKAASEDKFIMGICGGYQMLGEYISDKCGAETGESIRGIGLLPVVTEFAEEKHQVRAEGKVNAAYGMWNRLHGLELSGYEIHMGETRLLPDRKIESSCFSVLCDKNSPHAPREDGCVRGSTAGTYLHGIFDSDDFLKGLLEMLCEKKGVRYVHRQITPAAVRKEREYDRLADLIRENIDMDEIYRIIEVV